MFLRYRGIIRESFPTSGMDSTTIKLLSFSGKQVNFATWSTQFKAYNQTKSLRESWTGTAAEPVEPAASGEAPTIEQQEAHRVATEEFENNRKKLEMTKIKFSMCWFLPLIQRV